jgi:hypothetical protein
MSLEDDEAPVVRLPSLPHAFVALVHRLDGLTALMAHEMASHSETLAALRGHLNDCLYSGMLNIPVANQPYPIPFNLAVPFATLCFADPQGLGLSFDVSGMGGTVGVGTVKGNANDWGCVPLLGGGLSITAGATGQMYLALMTKTMPFAWGKC